MDSSGPRSYRDGWRSSRTHPLARRETLTGPQVRILHHPLHGRHQYLLANGCRPSPFLEYTGSMPVENNEQLDAVREAALKWVDSHWNKSRDCPVCGGNEWNVEDIMQMMQFHNGAIVIGGPTRIIPVVPVECVRCGYTMLFNAMIAGLIHADDKEHDERES